MTKDEKKVLCDALTKIIDLSTWKCDSDYNTRLSEILKPMERELGIADDMDERLCDLLNPVNLLIKAIKRALEEKGKEKDD